MLRLERLIPGISETNFTQHDFTVESAVELQKRHTVIRGERIATDFFDPSAVSINPTTGQAEYDETGKMVSFQYIFTRDGSYLVLFRDKTILWYNEDGTAHESRKQSRKTYSVLQRMEEGITRRRNVINFLKTTVLGFIAITEGLNQDAAIAEGKNYFELYDAESLLYIEADSDALQTATASDAALGWLDNDLAPFGLSGVSIRQFIVAEMNPPGVF